MKNKVGQAIAELHQAENDLAGELLQASDRHKADHDIFYLSRDLAGWSQEHVRRLAEYGQNHGVYLDSVVADDLSVIATVRQLDDDRPGRHDDPGLLLLKDLREIHRQAAGVSLDWEILAQTAQALKDAELLTLTQDCHPETLRQLRWANASLKSNAAQIMVSP